MSENSLDSIPSSENSCTGNLVVDDSVATPVSINQVSTASQSTISQRSFPSATSVARTPSSSTKKPPVAKLHSLGSNATTVSRASNIVLAATPSKSSPSVSSKNVANVKGEKTKSGASSSQTFGSGPPPLLLMGGQRKASAVRTAAPPSSSGVAHSGLSSILIPSPQGMTQNSFMLPHHFQPSFLQQSSSQQTLIVDPFGQPLGIVSCPVQPGYSSFSNNPSFLPLPTVPPSPTTSGPSAGSKHDGTSGPSGSAALGDINYSAPTSHPNLLVTYRPTLPAGIGSSSHSPGIFGNVNPATAAAINMMNFSPGGCYNISQRLPSTVVVRMAHGQLMGFQVTPPINNSLGSFPPTLAPITTQSSNSGSTSASNLCGGESSSASRSHSIKARGDGSVIVDGTQRMGSFHGGHGAPILPKLSTPPAAVQQLRPHITKKSASSTAVSSLSSTSSSTSVQCTTAIASSYRLTEQNVSKFELSNRVNTPNKLTIETVAGQPASAHSQDAEHRDNKYISDSPPSVESPSAVAESKDPVSVQFSKSQMNSVKVELGTESPAKSRCSSPPPMLEHLAKDRQSSGANACGVFNGSFDSERPPSASGVHMDEFFNLRSCGDIDQLGLNGDIDPHTLFMQEVERNSARRPNILTHFIDGFIIQESSEPFAVNCFPFADFVNEAMMELAAPPELEAEVSSNADEQEVNPPPLACELCGKSTAESAYPKQPEFCCKSCAEESERRRECGFPDSGNSPDASASSSSRSPPAKRFKAMSPLSSPSKSQLSSLTPTGTASFVLPSTSQHQAEAESPPPVPLDKNPAQWTVDDVHGFLVSLKMGEYAAAFRQQEIDGQALLLLREDHLMTSIGIKLGPAIKICNAVKNLRLAR